MALFSRLATSSYKSSSRRMRDPETVAPENTPVLFLVEHSESHTNNTASLPTIRALLYTAFIYTDVGDDENAIPSTTINALLDEIEINLRPDDPQNNRCTLGNLVHSVIIEGDITKAPGDVTGKSLAIVPIRVLVP